MLEQKFLIDIMGYIINTAPFVLLGFLPYENRLKLSKIKTVLVAISCIISSDIVYNILVNSLNLSLQGDNLLGIATVVPWLFVYFYLVDSSKLKLMFSICMVFHYAVFVTGLLAYTEAKLSIETYYSKHYNEFYIVAASIIHIILLPIMVLIIRKVMSPLIEETNDGGEWSYLFLMPTGFGITLLGYMATLEGSYITENIFLNVFVISYATQLIAYVVVGRLLINSIHTMKLERDISLMNKQFCLQKDQYELIRTHMEETKKVRHDFRHQLMVMNGMLLKKEYDKLSLYMEEYIEKTDVNTRIFICENLSVNSIMLHYLAIAAEHKISVDYNLVIPESAFVADVDLCILLGNAIENAIDACKYVQNTEERMIKLRCYEKGESLVITVDNSFDGKIERIGDKVLSRKEKGREGIGISSMRSIAERYQGVFQINTLDQIFMLAVILKK